MSDVITFEQIGSEIPEIPAAEARATFRLHGVSIASDVIAAGAFASGNFALEQINDGSPPPLPTFGYASGYLGLASAASGNEAAPPSEAASAFLLLGQSLGLDTANPSAFHIASLALTGFAQEEPLFEGPPLPEQLFFSSLFDVASAQLTGQEVKALTARLVLGEVLRVNTSLQVRLQELLTLGDRLTPQVLIEALSEFDLSSDLDNAVATYAALLESTLTLQAQDFSALDALVMLNSALSLADLVRAGYEFTLESGLECVSETSLVVSSLLEALSEFELEDDAAGAAVFTVFMTSEMEIEATGAMTADLLLQLVSELGATGTIRIGDTEYAAYAVNVATGSVAEYDRYEFNSFTLLDGTPIGATDDGIYVLEGDDDETLPINASVKTGLTDFGLRYYKQMLNAYVGYTTDGQLVMKVTSVVDGRKKENWYTLKQRDYDSAEGGRLSIQKGLKSLYWQFELVNVDGADFTLDSTKVWPMMLKRRTR